MALEAEGRGSLFLLVRGGRLRRRSTQALGPCLVVLSQRVLRPSLASAQSLCTRQLPLQRFGKLGAPKAASVVLGGVRGRAGTVA